MFYVIYETEGDCMVVFVNSVGRVYFISVFICGCLFSTLSSPSDAYVHLDYVSFGCKLYLVRTTYLQTSFGEHT